MEEVTLPFGKHKGQLISEVPKGYLRWLNTQDWLKEPLKGAVTAAIEEEPIPELAPPRPPWRPWNDRYYLSKEVEDKIHAVVKDADYWRARIHSAEPWPEHSDDSGGIDTFSDQK